MSGAAPPSDREVDVWLAELSKAALAGSAGSAGTIGLRRLSGYAQHSSEDQAQLVESYQQGLAARKVLAGDAASFDPVDVAAVQVLLNRRFTGSSLSELQLAVSNLSDQQKARCAHAVRNGTKAAELLAGANFRLLSMIVREKSEQRYGRESAARMFPDLISEANVVLLDAARQFDPVRGVDFPKFLALRVRAHVLAILSRQAHVRVPPSWSRVKRIAVAVQERLAIKLQRPPTMEEVKAELMVNAMQWAEKHLTDEQLRLPDDELYEAKLSKLRKHGTLGAIVRLEEVLASTQSVSSTSQPLSEDSSATLLDLVFDETDSDSLSAGVEAEELRATVSSVLSHVSERDQQVIRLRYGFEDGVCWTYADIAPKFGLTPERIRQIDAQVLELLRSDAELRGSLASHLDYDPGGYEPDPTRSGRRVAKMRSQSR